VLHPLSSTLSTSIPNCPASACAPVRLPVYALPPPLSVPYPGRAQYTVDAPRRPRTAWRAPGVLASYLTSTKRALSSPPPQPAPPRNEARAARCSTSSIPAPTATPLNPSTRPLIPPLHPIIALVRAWRPRAIVGWYPPPPARVLVPTYSRVAVKGRCIQSGWVRACQAEGTMRATRRSAAR
jgi:hypothetical protein